MNPETDNLMESNRNDRLNHSCQSQGPDLCSHSSLQVTPFGHSTAGQMASCSVLTARLGSSVGPGGSSRTRL